MAGDRRGILAGGNWIVDRVKIVDHYPREEKLANILRESSHNGGSPYNLLKDLAKLQAPFPLAGIGLVGEDNEGRGIFTDCRAQKIGVSQLHTTDRAPTSYTDVMTVESNGRRTFFHHPGANALLERSHFDLKVFQARIFHLGYLLLLARLDVVESGGHTGASRLLQEAVELGLETSVDLVSETSGRASSAVTPSLRYVDYLFVNEFEAEMVTGIPSKSDHGLDALNLSRSAEDLLRRGVKRWVFIHFAEGVFARNAGGQEYIQGAVKVPQEKILGTVGAGDALAAGVVLGLHERWDIQSCLLMGTCSAAASLLHPSCSDGVLRADACRDMGREFGYRELTLKPVP